VPRRGWGTALAPERDQVSYPASGQARHQMKPPQEANMDVERILTGAQEGMTVRRVFGDAMQADGLTIIPVAKIGGGGGGGTKGADEGSVGFGLGAAPAGVFVIRDGDARWRPAVDVNRVVLGGQLVAITAILVLGPILRRWLTQRLAQRQLRAATT
jgi:uncharacterized spore protein YtfJ